MSGGTKFSEVLLRVLVATCALLVVVLVLDHPQHPIMQLFFAAGAIYVLAFCLPQMAVKEFYHRLLREVHEGALESIINCVENGLQVPPRSEKVSVIDSGRLFMRLLGTWWERHKLSAHADEWAEVTDEAVLRELNQEQESPCPTP